MNSETGEVAERTRRLIIYQVVAGLCVAVAFGVWLGLQPALSAFFGAAISMSSVLMLGSGVQKAGRAALADPKRSLGILYFGAVKRFVLVLALFILGAKALELGAFEMGAGFIAAQLGFVLQFSKMAKHSV